MSGDLVVVVGSGGVGKTTLSAAVGLAAAARGDDTLVMTFDPSLRLKDTLGVGDAAKERPVAVAAGTAGVLEASLLDARSTFDRLVERHAPDAATRERILANRYYRHLSGSLAGVLEYMAVERLFEVEREGRYRRVVLDTPPTRQALDFLQAPSRVIGFLDSGALRIALKPWFDDDGRLRPTRRLGVLGRGLEQYLDRVVGLDVLRDMAEFFQAFAPLYDGFRTRAVEVRELLRRRRTVFVVVSGPAEERVADTMFLSRRLVDEGYGLGAVVVNQVHPRVPSTQGATSEGRRLFEWLAERDARGVASLRALLGGGTPLVEVPLLPRSPTDLAGLRSLARRVDGALASAAPWWGGGASSEDE